MRDGSFYPAKFISTKCRFSDLKRLHCAIHKPRGQENRVLPINPLLLKTGFRGIPLFQTMGEDNPLTTKNILEGCERSLKIRWKFQDIESTIHQFVKK